MNRYEAQGRIDAIKDIATNGSASYSQEYLREQMEAIATHAAAIIDEYCKAADPTLPVAP